MGQDTKKIDEAEDKNESEEDEPILIKLLESMKLGVKKTV